MFSANAVSAGTPGQNWTIKSAPVLSTYRNGAYGNGVYLYLANNAFLAVSSDANTWTQSNAMRTATLANTRAIVYSASLNGFFVASESAVVYSLNNGTSWTRVPISGTSTINNIAAGPPAVVGYDSAGGICRSTNGTTWSYVGPMTTLAGWGSGAFALGSYAADYGNGLFMIVGGNVSPTTYATCATSPDGLTWTNRPNLNVAFSGSMAKGIIWAPTFGKWFAWNSNRVIASSSDNGASWTVVPGTSSLLAGIQIEWVTEVNGTLVVLAGPFGSANTIITSANGVNWQLQPNLAATGFTTDGYGQNGGILFCASSSGKIAVSV